MSSTPKVECAFTAVTEASRTTTKFYDLVFQPSGLQATQFFTLLNIHQTGELSQCRFSRENTVAVSTVSRRLSSLRRKGLISLLRLGNHQERVYRLTSEGEKVLRETVPYWLNANRRFRYAMGGEQYEAVLTLCNRLVVGATRAAQAKLSNAASPRSMAASDSDVVARLASSPTL